VLVPIESSRPAPRALGPALDALRRGEVIIYPTDTGYAFGCALSSPRGIARLRKLKGLHERDRKPLTMLVNAVADLGLYGHLGNQAFRVVRRLLPGPYTIVLRASSQVPRAMRNRYREVGLRIPDHRVCNLLVELLGEPLLTGSVSRYDEGEFGLEDPEDLERIHGRDARIVIDGGAISPDPSTVLRLIGDEIEVLREGQGEVPV
jgi:tRNA threonylcarbamoyl adenosine modification protein (Sua5/YciO/YrdC/YwlC family)